MNSEGMPKDELVRGAGDDADCNRKRQLGVVREGTDSPPDDDTDPEFVILAW